MTKNVRILDDLSILGTDQLNGMKAEINLGRKPPLTMIFYHEIYRLSGAP